MMLFALFFDLEVRIIFTFVKIPLLNYNSHILKTSLILALLSIFKI
jgi:hypothetical protein